MKLPCHFSLKFPSWASAHFHVVVFHSSFVSFDLSFSLSDLRVMHIPFFVDVFTFLSTLLSFVHIPVAACFELLVAAGASSACLWSRKTVHH